MNRHIITAIALSITLCSIAQEDDFYGSDEQSSNKPKKTEYRSKLNRWAFGGNFWLSVGSSSYIELSPIALYKASPKFMVGPGFKLIYFKATGYNNVVYESAVYGPRAMAIYTLFSDLQEKIHVNIGNIVLQSEFEYLNLDEIDIMTGDLTGDKIWITNLLLGGGIFQPLGDRGGISIIVLYNIFDYNNTAYSFSNPEFRIGFYF